MCRKYLCDCSHCIDLDFDNCSSSELSDDAGDNAEEFEEKEHASYGHHTFDFVEVPSCATLMSGCSIEPLYFVLVKEKGIAEELLRGGFDHVINIGDMFFRDSYLKLAGSRNSSMKQFQVIARCSITSK